MDIFKDKEILEYLGIYQKKELTEEQIEEYMKIKKQIEKLTRTPIEKNVFGRGKRMGKNR